MEVVGSREFKLSGTSLNVIGGCTSVRLMWTRSQDGARRVMIYNIRSVWNGQT